MPELEVYLSRPLLWMADVTAHFHNTFLWLTKKHQWDVEPSRDQFEMDQMCSWEIGADGKSQHGVDGDWPVDQTRLQSSAQIIFKQLIECNSRISRQIKVSPQEKHCPKYVDVSDESWQYNSKLNVMNLLERVSPYSFPQFPRVS